MVWREGERERVKEDGDLYTVIPSQHVFMVFRPKAAQGSCKATAGSLSFSHRGCLAGTPSRRHQVT